MLDLVNLDRANLGLGLLTGDARLHDAAVGHSQDMQVNNFAGHIGSDGSNAGQRAQAAGYDWTAWGENVAAGQPTAQSVFDAWLNSPGHRDNMRSSLFTDIGIGFVPGTSSNTYDTYWTMMLAAGDSETGDPIVVLPPLPGLPNPNSPSVQDPAIQVSEVPLPPAFWLFVAALAAGLLTQRRHGPIA